VAFGLNERGSEQSALQVRDTSSGRLLPERIPHASFGIVAWLPDEGGFFYNASFGPDTAHRRSTSSSTVCARPPSEHENAIVREDEE
jgi:protease II